MAQIAVCRTQLSKQKSYVEQYTELHVRPVDYLQWKSTSHTFQCHHADYKEEFLLFIWSNLGNNLIWPQ